METRIKADKINLSKTEFNSLKKDLEKLTKIKPNEEVLSFSEETNLSIDQRDVVITGNSNLPYRVKFYHKKSGNRFLGSQEYRKL